MKPNGEKDIAVAISDFKIQAETGPFIALADFAALDENISPPKPIFQVEFTKEKIEADKKKIEEIE